jgi:AcrR family transcriptional regulator
MAHTNKDHAVRYNKILDVAQRLVYTKGYEQMTIQDILDGLSISKGAFYHYFNSKQSLLEALVDRIMDEAVQVILPVVDDRSLPALEKFQRFYDTLSRWKTDQKTFFLALLRVWYADDNAIVRQKELAEGIKRFTPLLNGIILQGVQEGVLSTYYPEQMGEVVLCLIKSLGDSLSELLLSTEPNRDKLAHIESTVAAYNEALERVLGAPSGALQLVDAEVLKEWVV